MSVAVRACFDLPGVAPADAFAAMVDLRAQERWMIATRLYPVASAVAVPERGSRVAAFTGVGGLGFLDTMTVTAFDPPHRWVVAKDGRLLRGVGTMQVQVTAEGCRACWTNELTPPLGRLGHLVFRLVGPLASAALQACLRRLAAQLRRGDLPLPPGPNPLPVGPDPWPAGPEPGEGGR